MSDQTQYAVVTRYGVPVRAVRTFDDPKEAQKVRRQLRKIWNWDGLRIEPRAA